MKEKREMKSREWGVGSREWRAVCILLVFSMAFIACTSKQLLEDPPIITSASHQHTLYNGREQAVEAKASKEGAPLPVITYFRSEKDLHADRNGSSVAPVEVGNYFVRIRRPAGNGYRAGRDITVEFHIQRALVTISAEARQEFPYDGNAKTVVFSVDQDVEPSVTYEKILPIEGSREVLSGPPVEYGFYFATITWSGDARYMGASKEVLLVIR